MREREAPLAWREERDMVTSREKEELVDSSSEPQIPLAKDSEVVSIELLLLQVGLRSSFLSKEVHHGGVRSFLFHQLAHQDLILWQNSSASNIKIFDVWEVVRKKYEEEPWRRLIWFPQAHPRAQWYVWLACSDRLPTFDKYKKSGTSLANRCVLCLKDEETAHHVLLSCPHSSKIWEFVASKFKRSILPQRTIVMELKHWFSCSFKRGWIMKCWKICFHTILWRIWCRRNSTIHNEDTMSPQQDSHAIWRVCVDGFYAILRDSVDDKKDLQVWLATGIVPDKSPPLLIGQACLQVASITPSGRKLVAFLFTDSEGLHLHQGVQWWEDINDLPEDTTLWQRLMVDDLDRFQKILLISNNKSWLRRVQATIEGRRPLQRWQSIYGNFLHKVQILQQQPAHDILSLVTQAM